MPVKIEDQGTIIKAEIHRPETRNAINFAVMDALESLLERLEKSIDVRLFIFTGSGNSFVSGGDLREFHQIKTASEAKKMSKRMHDILQRIEKLPFWTLAAINGTAYGGGWEMSLAFDFRLASTNAAFGFTQGAFYLPPGWGGLHRLSNIVGASQARYWLASQKVLSAEEAYRCGLVNELLDQNQFQDQLTSSAEKLVMNDRTFIEYLKKEHSGNFMDEIEPFSYFWESDIHTIRVDRFLKRKKE